MATFEEVLQVASLGGVTFPVASQADVTFSQTLARRKYPFRDGQDVEATGREPFATTLEVPLYEGMRLRGETGELWPERFEQLLAVIQDPENRERIDYVDPYFGRLDVVVVSVETETSSDRRNGVTVRIRLEEVSADPILFRTEADASTRERGVEKARALDAAIAGTELDEAEIEAAMAAEGAPLATSYSPGALFESATGAFFDVLDAGILALDELVAEVTLMTRRVNVIRTFDDIYGDPTNYELVVATTSLLDAVRAAGDEALSERPRIIDYLVPGPLSAAEIAAAVYGDPARADDVSRHNPIAGAVYPAGSRLVLEEP